VRTHACQAPFSLKANLKSFLPVLFKDVNKATSVKATISETKVKTDFAPF